MNPSNLREPWRIALKRKRACVGAKWCVALLLLPVAAFGMLQFGPRAALVLALSVGFCLAAGILPRLLSGERYRLLHDGGIVTGLLLGITLSAETPVYMILAGAVVAQTLGKWKLGPLGRNPLNPAALGRTAVALLEWLNPPWAARQLADRATEAVDIATGASPLPMAAGGNTQPALWDLLLGATNGAIGETSILLLALCGGLLLWQVALKRHAALTMLAATPLLVLVAPPAPEAVGHAPWASHPLWFTFGGGTFLTALFFATDPVTTPRTKAGGVIFGLGAAAVGVFGKLSLAIPGAEMYGILLMNLATPGIDRLVSRAMVRDERRPEPALNPGERLAQVFAAGIAPDARPQRMEPTREARGAAPVVTIDGQRLQAWPGATILEAARAAGAFVPTLCHLGGCKTRSLCRVCLVKLDGKALVPACSTKAADGMRIETGDPTLLAVRERILRMILAEHGRCGDSLCEVEDLARRMGVEFENLPACTDAGYRPLTDYLHERRGICIRCDRCMLACGERGVIYRSGRGKDAVMVLDAHACVDCGDCLAACPSGAICRV